jgi:Holliday junction resolvase RusA-like endonuclease
MAGLETRACAPARDGAQPVIIRLAGEPKGKGRPRFARASGRAFTPAATRSYEAALRYAAQETMGERPLMVGALEILVVANFPVPKSFSKAKRLAALAGEARPTVKPDVDNLLKTIDALNGVVFEDDKQIVSATVQKFYSDRPDLTIRVMPMGEAA